MSWTDAKIATMTRLWNDGVSAGGIAQALGDVSRSAVLGKLHRLKLLKSRKAAADPRGVGGDAGAGRFEPVSPASIARPRPRPQFVRSPWRSDVFRPLPESLVRPWLQREIDQCPFPVGGKGVTLLACCAPLARGSAYCAGHRRIMYRNAPADHPAAGAIVEPFHESSQSKRNAA